MPEQSNTPPVPASSAPHTPRWLAGLVATLLMLGLSVWYHSRPVAVMTDSLFGMLVAERWLEGKGPGLDDAIGPDPALLDQEPWPYQAEPGYNRVLQVHQPPTRTGKVTLWYPQASSMLAVPWLALQRLFGPATVWNAAGRYDIEREQALQHALAADVTALAVAVLFLTALLWLPWWQALLVALGVGLASPLLSTASRTMWNQTWGVLIGSLLLYELASSYQKQRVVSAFWTGTALAWLYFCRPALITQVAVVGLYLLWRDWRSALRVTAVGLGWGTLWLLWNHWQLGEALPNYYRHARLGDGPWLLALQGVLISPSRGLLVFVPWLVPAGVLALVGGRKAGTLSLVVLCLCGIVAHVLLVSLYGNWWGGHSYGPRLLLDAQPMMGLLAVLAVAALPRVPRLARWSGVAALLLTGALGGFIHHRGATDSATFRWNVTPRPIDADTLRIFDWSHAQFLVGLTRWPLPALLPPFPEGGELLPGLSAAEPYLLEGWSGPELAHRWTDGAWARLAWDELDGGASELSLRLRVFVWTPPGTPRTARRVRVSVQAGADGPLLAERDVLVQSNDWQTWQLPVAKGPPGPRVLTIQTPDALAPFDVLGRGEQRRLGVALASVRRLGPVAR